MATKDDENADIDGLYALPAGEFVAARNSLVKQLKADKRTDEAAEVAALRKPTVVAWALNQVAREDPDAVAILIDAARGVADAQRDVMAGGDAKALRAASAAQRGAAAEVADAAVRLAGQNNADAVSATLDAALTDDDLTGRLRDGTLTETLDAPAGFGFGLGVDVAPAAPRRKPATKTAAKRTGTTKPAPAGKADDAAARKAAAAARKEVARLDKALEKAERDHGRATRSMESAEKALSEAEQMLADAQRRVVDATSARDDAASALDTTAEDRDQLARELEDARAQL
jgi:hypothetical protein